MKFRFSVIIADTSRSLAYLKALKKEKIYPEYSIILNNKIKNIYITKKILEKYLSNSILLNFKSFGINDKIKKFVYKNKLKNIIFSGNPGYIVRDKFFLKKTNLIHCHPGKLPEFKGSTPIYYSLLKKKTIHCSSLIINHKLDSGKILFVKNFKIPKNIKSIDKSYDDLIRSKTLVYTIKNLKDLKRKIKYTKNNKTYFVIHPVLRAITFKKNFIR